VYRPGCPECNACTPVRIRCKEFISRRTDRRNLKHNADLQVDFRQAYYTEEYFTLYCKYLNARHPNGGMDNPDPEDFSRFLLNPWGETLFLEIRLEGSLLAIAVTDVTSDGLSAVYTFFDPDHGQRALGKFCILKQIEQCQNMSQAYLYLGYWVDGCQKMQYKTDFQPQEHFTDNAWKRAQSKNV